MYGQNEEELLNHVMQSEEDQKSLDGHVHEDPNQLISGGSRHCDGPSSSDRLPYLRHAVT